MRCGDLEAPVCGRRRIALWLFVAFATALVNVGSLHAQETPPDAAITLAVLNFVNRNPGDGWDWLQKGLADMLITDLGASGRLEVVERERMQLLSDEMQLAGLGVLDADTVQGFGKVAGVQYAVFGSYFREEGKIEIECHIVEVATQKLRRVEWVQGADAAVLELEKELALKVIQNLDIALTDQERGSLLHMRTTGLQPAKLYYAGIDSYDAGDYIAALGLFRQAIRLDVEFEDARFRIGQMFYDLGEPEHAMVEFERVASGPAGGYYTGIAKFLAAQIEGDYLGRSAHAAQHYISMAKLHAGSQLAVVAAFRAGCMLQQLGRHQKAYGAYRLTDDLVSDAAEAGRLYDEWTNLVTGGLKWLRYEARHRYGHYLLLWHLSGRLPAELPQHVVVLGPRQNVLEHTSSGPGGAPAETQRKDRPATMDRAGTYFLLCEQGYALTQLAVTLRVKRSVAETSKFLEGESFNRSCYIYVFDMVSQETLGYAEVAFADAGTNLVTVNLKQACPGAALFVREMYHLELVHLRVEGRFQAIADKELDFVRKDLENRLSGTAMRPPFVHLSALLDQRGMLRVVATDRTPFETRNLTHQFNGDLWIASGPCSLGMLKKMRINSLRDDYHGCLAQDNVRRYWLVFCSQRRAKRGVALWLARSPDCEHWTCPKRLELDIEWDYKHLSLSDYGKMKRLSCPRLMIDSGGLFWLAFCLGGEVYITNSSDAVQWQKPVQLGPAYGDQALIALCEDSAGKAVVAFSGVFWFTRDDQIQNDEGILIAKVARDLTFEKRTVRENFPYVQPKYGWKGEYYRPIGLFRKQDGKFLLFCTRNPGLEAYISSDLAAWTSFEVSGGIPYHWPATVLIDGGDIVLVTDEPHGLTLKKIPLDSVLPTKNQ